MPDEHRRDGYGHADQRIQRIVQLLDQLGSALPGAALAKLTAAVATAKNAAVLDGILEEFERVLPSDRRDEDSHRP